MSTSLFLTLASLASAVDRRPWPLDAPASEIRIVQDYGSSEDDGHTTRVHLGVDLAVEPGTRVYAAEAGEVLLVLDSTKYQGGCVIAGSGPAGRKIQYLHLARETVQFAVGDLVEAGDLLGEVVDWGTAWPGCSHLHLEVGEGHVFVFRSGSNFKVQAYGAFQALDNPRDAFLALPDTSPPVLSAASQRGPLRFDEVSGHPANQDRPYDHVRSPFEVVVDVHDPMDGSTHKLPPHEIEIEVLQGDEVVDVRRLRFDEALGQHQDRVVSIASDRSLRGRRLSYRSLGWNDGHSTSSPGMVRRPFDLEPGQYRVRVRAWDYAGNATSPTEVLIHVRP